jgi:hypothetical protein
MSATIPLPALDVQPPPQQDPLQQYSRMMAMRGMQQQQQGMQLENQKRQLDLESQQGLKQAYVDANGDPQKFLANASNPKYNIAFDGILQARQRVYQMQQQYYQMSNEQIAQQQKITDIMQGAHDRVVAAPADQRPIVYQRELSNLSRIPGVDVSKLPPQYPGDDQFQFMGASLQGHTQMLADAKTKAETAKNLSQAAGAKYKAVNGALWDVSGPTPTPVLTQGMQADGFAKAVDAVVPPTGPNQQLNARTKAMVNLALQQGNLDAANRALTEASQQVGGIEKEINPQVQAGKVKVAAAEGAARANVEAQFARGSNAALANVPPHLVAPASSAATKAGEDYAQAQSVTQRLQQMMDAARKGNVVSYQVLPEEGTLQITTSQGVHRINQAEIAQYAGGGSLWQRMQGHIGKQLTGQSIPPSVLDDMAQIQAIQASGSRSKYENSLKTINQNYGSNFQPVNMGQGTSGGASQSQPGNDPFAQFGGRSR